MQRIMESGAIGCEIVLSGKISGQRGRRERFIAGYLKKCGEPAKRDVAVGFAVANPKLGNIGVTVKIMLKRSELSIKIPEHTAPEEVKEKVKSKPKEKVKEEPTEKVKEEPTETQEIVSENTE